MKLRYFLILVFFILALGPLALLTLWPQTAIFKNEMDQVYERHLLIAQNLAAALTRYHRDLVTTFELFANDPNHWQMMEGTTAILTNLSFHNICMVDIPTGKIISDLALNNNACPRFIPTEKIAMFATLAASGTTTFSEVMANPQGDNVIHLLLKTGDKLVIGTLDTKYFQELGTSISFGIKGHAAIVDQNGNALSHPLADWVTERKDMSGISAVQRMMNAETGVEQFYSPALKGDMIAGFASVEPVGWGVMIPQPIAELQAKAADALWSIIVVLLFGVVIALGLAIWISILLARPLEWVNNQTQRVADGDFSHQPEINGIRLLPVEFQTVPCNVREMTARLSKSVEKVNRLAYLDPLTGIANRASFQRNLKEATDVAGGVNLGTLLFIDLDRFKEINDTHGHDFGDAVLKVAADRICHVCDALLDKSVAFQNASITKTLGEKSCARLGGDEFAVFLPNQTAVEGYTIAEELVERLSEPIDLGIRTVTIGASIGIAQYPNHGQNDKELLRASDLAMYEAKANGKGGAFIFDPSILVRQKNSNQLGVELLDAIENGQLEPYFQPQYWAHNLSLSGVESLVRWRHPVHGVLGPADFLSLATELGLIEKIDEIMLNSSVHAILALRRRGLEIPSLAVNISAERLMSERILDDVRALGSLPFDLKFELLETISLDNIDPKMAKTIGNLREMGVKIEMDDFGSGHASIIALMNLRPDTLKIDGRLVAKLSEDEFRKVSVQAIVNLGHGAGIQITAEGVETAEQLQILRSIGCDTIQGFYLGHPMAADDLFEFVVKGDVRTEMDVG